MEGARSSAAGREEPCLEDDVFLRYFAGDLGQGEEAEVRAHVARCDDCRAALAEEARHQAASFDASAASSRRTIQRPEGAHEPEPGDTIGGRYRVDKRIGYGGMGIVYAAKDLERNVPVAVKIMNRDRADEPDSVARFLRETRVVACVDSEHVVKIYDVGTLDNGTPYMATELLIGKDLHDRKDEQKGPIEVDVAVDWILQATRGLAAAHAAGIIHRDVKLSNMFLARARSGDDVVKVIDFGLCKSVSSADAEAVRLSASLTTADSMMGTPHYMSPEQYVSARDVSTATDVWALGVCLYHLCTGKVPFDGPNVTNICAKVVRGEFIPPRKLREEIPVAIEKVITKCLARDPQDRYRDARELLDALARAIDESAAPTLDSNRGYKKNEALATTQPMPPPPGAHPRGVHTTSRNAPLAPTPAKKTSPLLTLGLAMAVVLFVIAFVAKRHRAHAVAPDPHIPESNMTAMPAATTATTTPAQIVPATAPAPEPAPAPLPSASAEPSTKASLPKPARPPPPPAVPTPARVHTAPASSKDPLYDKY